MNPIVDSPHRSGANHAAALETIERVLAEALGRDLDRLPVFSPRNVTSLAFEAAARIREGR